VTRRVAAGVVAAQVVAELVAIGLRHDLAGTVRVFQMAVVVLQVVFAWGVLRYSAGSVFGLLVLEAVTVLAAIGTDAPGVERGALAASALAVIVLVLRSLAEFPPAPLPRSPGSVSRS